MTKKKKEISIPNYSLSEELINSISHGIAAGLSIWGLVMLIIKASHVGALAVTTVTIFGTTMVLLYTISCIYHALSSKVRGKKVLRVLDHCNVFLLVFGTIIPVALLGIGGAKGWICFGIVAFVTTIGIITSAISIEKVQIFEVVCHLLNGWSMLIYIKISLELQYILYYLQQDKQEVMIHDCKMAKDSRRHACPVYRNDSNRL